MKIIFRSIQFISASSLKDKAELVISGMGSDVVNEIVSNPNLIGRGAKNQ